MERIQAALPFQHPAEKGKFDQSHLEPVLSGHSVYFEHQNGKLYLGNSLDWLSSLEEQSVNLIFADPPYNINKAAWDDFESQEHYIQWSLEWIEQASRVLKNTGSLYICGFSEILADLKHPALKYFVSCRWLVWHYKNKANLGNDWGRSHESIIHLRKSSTVKVNIDPIRIPYGAHTLKYPSHPQAQTSQYGDGKNRQNWIPHPLGAKPKDVIEFPTTCNGMGEKTPHPTQKPEGLIRKFILASSKPDEVVLDPFSGSGTTIVAAEQLGRKWLGCDINPQYNQWAVQRICQINQKTVEEWIAYDKTVAARREGIR